MITVQYGIHFDTDPKTPNAINMKNAAALYEVFQRVAALDNYFGLHKEIECHSYPLTCRKQSSRNVDRQHLDIGFHSTASEDSDNTESTDDCASIHKVFTVDMKYRSRLVDREMLMNGDHQDNGEEECADAKSERDIQPSASIHSVRGVSQGKSTVGEQSELIRNAKMSSIDTNFSEKTAFSSNAPTIDHSDIPIHSARNNNNGSHNAGMDGNSQHRMRIGGHTLSKLPEEDNAEVLMFAESLQISKLDWSQQYRTPQKKSVDTECNLTMTLEDVAMSWLYPGEKTNKRLKIMVWIEQWFWPNLTASFSLLRNTLLECSGGVQQYFRPLKLSKLNKPFNEVFLSSLEYAILKDELTRGYFYIQEDHKEHLMMREIDDFRRLNMRKRITFDEFCYHFSPYLSRNPEDYTRSKNVDTVEEALQRRALQSILQKNIYGISIEKPNEFFNKQCVLKPFQVLEPIPQK
ncbi:hypothetical protein BaOVIS_015950 [Babesia ovis]|uniref:Uncharacterized protein n=1 Tax=Babesia ovis TaxID=5869 RepID=A0A9W5WUR7_BABOV|nr:hypothetical protein BaOVIS_015950 [Babesia ovis]